MSDFPEFENEQQPGPQIVPHNREAEEAVLGSIMINPESYYDVAQFLQSEDFYIHRHRWIWEAFKSLNESRTPIDFLTVTAELEKQGQLVEIGGAAYLTALTNIVPSSLHAESYGRIVEETAVRRRMLDAANQIAKLAYEEETGLEAVMDDAEKAVFGVTERRMTRDLEPIKEVLSEYYDRIGDLAARGDEIRGVPTGFIDLDKLLAGFQPSDLIIVAGRPGMGKCVTSDTKLVNPNTGDMVDIETLVRDRQGDLLTMSNHYKLMASRATQFVDDGIKPVFRVRTSLGREIKVTLSHPFLTIKGWQPLGELKIGDYIAVPRMIPVFGKEDVPEHEAIILAYMLADGSMRCRTPCFTNSDSLLRDDFIDSALLFPSTKARIGDDHGGRTPTVYISGDLGNIRVKRKVFAQQLTDVMEKRSLAQSDLAGEVGVSVGTIRNWRAGICSPSQANFNTLCGVLELSETILSQQGFAAISRNSPNNLTLWLMNQGVWGKSAAEKKVPDCVFRYTKEKLALFLDRLFACDGSIHFQQGKQPVISYSSVSENLARDVQHLLLRFGIIAKLRYRQVKYKSERQPPYELRITGVSNIKLFLDQIGIFGKEQIIEQVRDYIQNTSSNVNLDIIPMDVWSVIIEAKGTRTWRSVYDDMNLPLKANIHVGQRAPSRQRLLDIGQAVDSQPLLDLAQSDIYWDKITTIEYLGERQVYDLTVPDTHNFVADDMLVHNTGFALSAAKNAAQTHKKHVAIFSLEMSNEQLVQRLIAQETGIDSQRLRTGQLEENEWGLFTEAIEALSDTRIFLDDTPAITPLQLRTKCRRLHLEHRLDLIIVDYLQLMSGDSRTDNRVQEVSYISRNLKILARELNVPVLAAAQLSRAVEQRGDKTPILSDLRESGSLEQDSDVVMFIYRPEVYDDDPSKQNLAEIIVAKHRNGPVGRVQLVFRKNLAKFENATTRDVDLLQVS